jgi:hypothetical protein
MTVTVCMNEAGAIWIENDQGDILAECFFKTAEETEDELRHMGYPRLLTMYPTAHMAAGTGMDPAELGEVFLEVGRQCGHGLTAGPQRDDTPWAGACYPGPAGGVMRSETPVQTHAGLARP